MKILFSFFVRLFVAFLAAKFLLGLLAADTPGRLVGLALILVANTYLFELCDWYYDGGWRRALAPAELGWLFTRLAVMINSVRRRKAPAESAPGPAGEPPRDPGETG